MKTRNLLIAVVSLLLFVLVAWFSCEKESNDLVLKEANPTADFEVPADVAAYFTTEQIDEFYAEVAKERTTQPPDYVFVPITIKMENKVSYMYNDGGSGERYADVPGWVIGVQFEGNGMWKEMGNFKYNEKVTFLIDEANSEKPLIGSKGEGSIFLTTIPKSKTFAPSRENLLTFDSKDRMMVSGVIKPKDEHPMPADDNARLARNSKFKSKLAFNGGYGIFDRAFGYATKMEFHDAHEPGVCSAAILGYVFVKRGSPTNPEEL